MRSNLLIGIWCFFVAADAFAQIPTNGLIGHWDFSGNANDISGNGNDGTVSGATLTPDRFGNANSAYLFNGSTDYIQMFNAAVSGNSDRTVCFWAKTSFTGEMVPFDYGDPTSGGGTFQIQFNNACNGIGLDVANGVITKSNNSVLDNNWHHFALVLDANNGTQVNQIIIYQDGVLLTSITCGALNQNSPINTINTNPIRVGKTATGNIRHFNGSLDDFLVYERAIQSSGIDSIFNDPNPATLSIADDSNLSEISVYPNPAYNSVEIKFNESDFGSIFTIFDINGKIIKTHIINQNSITLNKSEFLSGMYFIRISNENNIQTHKLVFL